MKIATTAANESWNPGSSTAHGSSQRQPAAATERTCQRATGRLASQASATTTPVTPARTTDAPGPTTRTYRIVAAIAAPSAGAREMPSQPHTTTTAPTSSTTFWPETASRCPRPEARNASRVSGESPSSPPSTTPSATASPSPARDVQRSAGTPADRVDRAPHAGPAPDDLDRAGPQHLVDALAREPLALVEAVGRRPVRGSQVAFDVEHLPRLERACHSQQHVRTLEARDRALIPLPDRDGAGHDRAPVHLAIDLSRERVVRQGLEMDDRRDDAHEQDERSARDAERTVESHPPRGDGGCQRDAHETGEPRVQRRRQREAGGERRNERAGDDLTARRVHEAPRGAPDRCRRRRRGRRRCGIRRARCATRRSAPRATARCRRARRAARPSRS